MPNYIVSYDLNGNTPTHAQMDKHMGNAGYTRGRILETVWYVKSSSNLETVFNHIDKILSSNDRLIVTQATLAKARNLLIPIGDISKVWDS